MESDTPPFSSVQSWFPGLSSSYFADLSLGEEQGRCSAVPWLWAMLCQYFAWIRLLQCARQVVERCVYTFVSLGLQELWWGKTDWPFKALPVSASPVLRLQVLTPLPSFSAWVECRLLGLHCKHSIDWSPAPKDLIQADLFSLLGITLVSEVVLSVRGVNSSLLETQWQAVGVFVFSSGSTT